MSEIRIRGYENLNARRPFPRDAPHARSGAASPSRDQLEPDAEVPSTRTRTSTAGTSPGRVPFRIGPVESELGPGSSYLIPGDVPHHVVALEDATLIEVFSPVREDFADD